MGGPLRVRLEFLFPVPRSWPKWKRAAALEGSWRHQGSVDVDNLGKLALDALQPGWFADDRQVVELHLTKGYAEAPGVWLEWEELPQAQRRKP
jgi:Holliday junction resolvase RusA-like endonuclease